MDIGIAIVNEGILILGAIGFLFMVNYFWLGFIFSSKAYKEKV